MSFAGSGPGDVSLGPGDRASATAAVKALLRIATGDEDALIGAFVEATLGLAEQFTGQVMIARAMAAAIPALPEWQPLPAVPVRTITGLWRIGGPALGVDTQAIDIAADATGWVRVLDSGGAALVEARFTAGLAPDWETLPAPIRQGVVLLAGHLFVERDPDVAPPAAVTALWRPYRRLTLGRQVRA